VRETWGRRGVVKPGESPGLETGGFNETIRLSRPKGKETKRNECCNKRKVVRRNVGPSNGIDDACRPIGISEKRAGMKLMRKTAMLERPFELKSYKIASSQIRRSIIVLNENASIKQLCFSLVEFALFNIYLLSIVAECGETSLTRAPGATTLVCLTCYSVLEKSVPLFPLFSGIQ
jgi:hypothetical protein